MPTRCTYRPNRSHPRKFSRQDAARVVCKALGEGDGVSPAGQSFTTFSSNDPDGSAGAIRNTKGGRQTSFIQIGGVRVPIDADLDDILRRVELICGSSTGIKNSAALAAAAAQAVAGQEVDVGHSTFVMQHAADELEKNRILWINLLEFFAALAAFLGAIVAAGRFFPPLRLISTGAGFLLKRVQGFQGTIISRQAANDGTAAALRRQILLLEAA